MVVTCSTCSSHSKCHLVLFCWLGLLGRVHILHGTVYFSIRQKPLATQHCCSNEVFQCEVKFSHMSDDISVDHMPRHLWVYNLTFREIIFDFTPNPQQPKTPMQNLSMDLELDNKHQYWHLLVASLECKPPTNGSWMCVMKHFSHLCTWALICQTYAALLLQCASWKTMQQHNLSPILTQVTDWESMLHQYLLLNGCRMLKFLWSRASSQNHISASPQ